MARLWLGLSEEWNKEMLSDGDGEDPADDSSAIDLDALMRTESYQTSRAAIGTLAVAASDPEVCAAVLAENCASTVVSLLQSAAEELVHRALAFALTFVNTNGVPAAKHLLEGGVVPALHVGTKMSNPRLRELCKEVGLALSAALKTEADEAAKAAAAAEKARQLIADTQTSGLLVPTATMQSDSASVADAVNASSGSRFEELD